MEWFLEPDSSETKFPSGTLDANNETVIKESIETHDLTTNALTDQHEC